ncbi:MAG: class I SAM-dependent methyltransferase [Candidatus Omnitrophica bacterium]|nr:class I SAM-dependent methyltransferase [Candidatus Omnitrophota bacterium]
MWDSHWEKVFQDREWGRYPAEDLVRFMGRNYYNVPNRKQVKILEVGSGTGANLWYLAKEGFDVTGIEGSKTGVERSIKRLKEDGLSARVMVGDVIKLPFEDDYFDCVVDIECIYANSYGDSKKIIREIRRTLKPGGKLFSKTLMSGTSGDGKGQRLEGEENTYIEFDEGAFRRDGRLTRFTAEKEIGDLYNEFNMVSLDYSVRTEKNREIEIKEWLIICQKKT